MSNIQGNFPVFINGTYVNYFGGIVLFDTEDRRSVGPELQVPLLTGSADFNRYLLKVWLQADVECDIVLTWGSTDIALHMLPDVLYTYDFMPLGINSFTTDSYYLENMTDATVVFNILTMYVLMPDERS